MFPDSFLMLSAIAFLIGLLNSSALGERLCRPGFELEPRILDISLALVPIMAARLGVGSGMSVVLTGFSSLMSFHLAHWLVPKYSLQRYVPALVTLGFLSPLTLALVGGLWWLLRRQGIPYSVLIVTIGFVSLPILWFLHHRDLYVLFALAWLILILYNEIPHLRWERVSPTSAEHLTTEMESLPRKVVVMRRCMSISLILLQASFFFFNRYVYRGFGLQQELFRVGNRDLPFIALTFDDGPDPLYTPRILDILKEKEVSATFFLLGKHAEQYPHIVRRIAEEGHDIGNHTYSHRNLYGLDEPSTWNEIARADTAISDIIDTKIYLFRPPRGMYTQSTVKFAHELQYTTVLWSISSRDWAEISSGNVERNILRNTKGGDILLFHDSGSIIGTSGGYRYNTVNALPIIIDGLRAKGFHFVTVNQLMIIAGLTEGDDELLPDILDNPPFTRE
ncbi:MAG: polysaccharide deacetylase family protein [Firmicutes bacterium]|nr:polysaccharide deacetylase family protein [Bacillota bacterium]